jgi:hypothetical protein
MTENFRLLAGLIKGALLLYLVHFSAMGPDGIGEVSDDMNV